jgi:hypothetical protein
MALIILMEIIWKPAMTIYWSTEEMLPIPFSDNARHKIVFPPFLDFSI